MDLGEPEAPPEEQLDEAELELGLQVVGALGQVALELARRVGVPPVEQRLPGRASQG
jgi:hypothetical protein